MSRTPDKKAPLRQNGAFPLNSGVDAPTGAQAPRGARTHDAGSPILPRTRRIIVVTGHYGSGKTEFSVSLAMSMAAQAVREYPRIAVIDMDVANPYFRTRERRDTLEKADVAVYGSIYDTEITAELPALGAALRAPLEDPGCRAIVDAGGNDSGALVLNQFRKYFTPETATVLAVVNANRPETRTPDGALEHIAAIEAATRLRIDAIVNNTHLLRQTTADDIIRGHALALEVCARTGKALFCDCYPEKIVNPRDLRGVGGYLMPLGLYMRPTWLDR